MSDHRKSITKEMEVCHDCAEYGGSFCDDCMTEIKKLKVSLDPGPKAPIPDQTAD
tara:strand:+ start:462 stop:626 length:165 start_codon:yes stop_codon:yes gene_type:complete